MPDQHKNLAYSTVATAPSPAASGTSLVVEAGHGTRFPTVPFNATVWPAGAIPTPANAEIVRVTAIATDTFTITRTQESTSARTIVMGDQIAATITAKTLTDVEGDIPPTHLGFLVRHSVAQSINNDVNTVVALNTEEWDDDGFHAAGDNTKISFDAGNAGRYALWINADFAPDADGWRRAFARLNGVTTILRSVVTVSRSDSGAVVSTQVTIYFEFEFAAGDYFEVIVRHNAGAALNLNGIHVGGHRIKT